MAVPVAVQSRSGAGFSLVELVMALFVLSFGVLGLATTTLFVTRQLTLSEVTTARATAVQSVMERLRATPYDSIGAGQETIGPMVVSWSVTVANAQTKTIRIVSVGPGQVSFTESQSIPMLSAGVVELEQTAEYVVEASDGSVRISIANRSGFLDFDPWETQPMFSSPAMFVDQAPVVVQDQPLVQQASRRMSIAFDNTPIVDVLFTFSEFSGKSIVPGSSVVGAVTADIRDQAWDDALEVILASRGLIGIEDENGIIRVAGIENLNQQEAIEPLLTVPYRISYGTSAEMALATAQLISDRGPGRGGPGCQHGDRDRHPEGS